MTKGKMHRTIKNRTNVLKTGKPGPGSGEVYYPSAKKQAGILFAARPLPPGIGKGARAGRICESSSGARHDRTCEKLEGSMAEKGGIA